MIRKLTVTSALILSSTLFATDNDERDKPKNWWDVTNSYVQLMENYKSVCEDDFLTQIEKAEKVQNISQGMVDISPEGIFLNKDYNDCMRESNKQQRSDYDRCDKNDGGDKCYDRADNNNDNRRAACERVSHSDNASRAASSSNGGSKKSRAGDRR